MGCKGGMGQTLMCEEEGEREWAMTTRSLRRLAQ